MKITITIPFRTILFRVFPIHPICKNKIKYFKIVQNSLPLQNSKFNSVSEKCFFAFWLPRNVLKIIWMEGIFCCKIPKRNESTTSKLKLLYRAVAGWLKISWNSFPRICVYKCFCQSLNLCKLNGPLGDVP